VDIGAGHSSEPTDKVLIQFLVVLFFLVPRQRQGYNYKYTYHVQELQIIDPEEARQVLGQSAIQIVGLSVVVYDTTQYMTVCRSKIVRSQRNTHFIAIALLPLVGRNYLRLLASIQRHFLNHVTTPAFSSAFHPSGKPF
jgi:hypothetical protein